MARELPGTTITVAQGQMISEIGLHIFLILEDHHLILPDVEKDRRRVSPTVVEL